MVARLLWEQDVAGSNPVIPTIFLLFQDPLLSQYRHTAAPILAGYVSAQRWILGIDLLHKVTGRSRKRFWLHYWVAQCTPVSYTHLYKDGIAVAAELKGAFDDIKSALDFTSFLKK